MLPHDLILPVDSAILKDGLGVSWVGCKGDGLTAELGGVLVYIVAAQVDLGIIGDVLLDEPVPG